MTESRSKARREGREPKAPGRPATAQPAMQAQNYRVVREVCSKCKHFTTAGKLAEWAVKLWPNDPEKWKSRMVQTGKRCGIGDFSVKDSATCDLWESADAVKP